MPRMKTSKEQKTLYIPRIRHTKQDNVASLILHFKHVSSVHRSYATGIMAKDENNKRHGRKIMPRVHQTE